MIHFMPKSKEKKCMKKVCFMTITVFLHCDAIFMKIKNIYNIHFHCLVTQRNYSCN